MLLKNVLGMPLKNYTMIKAAKIIPTKFLNSEPGPML
jgi:hypothetical protein